MYKAKKAAISLWSRPHLEEIPGKAEVEGIFTIFPFLQFNAQCTLRRFINAT